MDLGCKGRSNDEGNEMLHISQGKRQLRYSSDRCVNLLRSMSIEQRGKNKESRYKKHKQQQPMINESVGDILQISRNNTLGVKKFYCKKMSDKN